MTANQQKIITDAVTYMKELSPKYNIVCYTAILGQMILESSFCTSELAVNANNYFGLKYNQSQPNRCPSANGYYVKVGSEQNKDGSYSSSTMLWQKFPDFKSGISGYFEFLSYSSRYNNLKGITDPRRYLEIIKSDGYCTSQLYVENVMNVIKKYELEKYVNNTAQTQTTGKLYRVQVGAYSQKENAEAMLKKLESLGIKGFVTYS